MAYCTSAHVRLRLPEFPSDVAHEAIVTEAISAAQAEVDMSPLTQGAIVDDSLQTSKAGIFACGNVLHVHDLVDFVSAESFKAGKAAADYVKGSKRVGAMIDVRDGDGVRGVVPQRLLVPEGEAQPVQLMFRPAAVYENATVRVLDGDREVLKQKKRILTPGEMESFPLDPTAIPADADTVTFVVEEAQAQ